MLHEAVVIRIVCVVPFVIVLILRIFWDIEGGVVFRGEVHVDGTLAALQKELETLKTGKDS